MHALNVGIVNQVFREQFLLGQVTSFHEGSMDIFHGVRIMATHNVRKDVGVVNGSTGIVVAVLTQSHCWFTSTMVHCICVNYF